MAFVIDPIPDDGVPFTLPAKTGTVDITVPRLGDVAPKILNQLDKDLKKDRVPGDHPESTRYLLRLLVEGKESQESVEGLTVNQLVQISEIWNEESGVSMGESEGSTNSSKNAKA